MTFQSVFVKYIYFCFVVVTITEGRRHGTTRRQQSSAPRSDRRLAIDSRAGKDPRNHHREPGRDVHAARPDHVDAGLRHADGGEPHAEGGAEPHRGPAVCHSGRTRRDRHQVQCCQRKGKSACRTRHSLCRSTDIGLPLYMSLWQNNVNVNSLSLLLSLSLSLSLHRHTPHTDVRTPT